MKFHQLTHGKFSYLGSDRIHVVHKRDENSITIKRPDNWLVTVQKGDWSWDREVVCL